MPVPICKECGEMMKTIYLVDKWKFAWTEDHGYLADPGDYPDDPDIVVTECGNCGEKYERSLLDDNIRRW